MIEKVEEFSPELNRVSLVDAKILEWRKICIHEAGAGKLRTGNVSKFPYWRWYESTRIKPIQVVVNLGRRGAGRVCCHGSTFERVTHFVRAVLRSSIPFEIDARLVIAVNQEEGEPRGRLFDQIDLPPPENRVRNSTPVAAVAFAFAEGQFVEDAGGELII